MSVFIYTTLFIFILFCNVFFNLKHKKYRHYSFRNSKWRQKSSFLTLGHLKTMIEKAGHILEYLPPYSPDLNPIEPKWAQAKSRRRKYRCDVDTLFEKYMS